MNHEEKRKLLEKQDWGEIRATLVKFALFKTKSLAWANDLAQEAILRIHDTKREPWDPAKHPDLRRYLIGMVRQLASNDWRSARRHRELEMEMEDRDDDENADGVRRAPPGPSKLESPDKNAEEVVATNRLLARRMMLLRARIPETSRALVILELYERGIEDADAQAKASGLSIKDIRNARKRFFEYAEEVARDLPEGAYDDDASAEDLGPESGEVP